MILLWLAVFAVVVTLGFALAIWLVVAEAAENE